MKAYKLKQLENGITQKCYNKKENKTDNCNKCYHRANAITTIKYLFKGDKEFCSFFI